MLFDSPFSTSLFAFLFQFENGRFEMIIIMPRNHRGLAFFHNEAKTRLQDSSFDGNILDEALDALERRRTVHEVHVINMPSFKVDTNMDVQKHLRTVNSFSSTLLLIIFNQTLCCDSFGSKHIQGAPAAFKNISIGLA